MLETRKNGTACLMVIWMIPVGAVYDRALVPLDRENRAVIKGVNEWAGGTDSPPGTGGVDAPKAQTGWSVKFK